MMTILRLVLTLGVMAAMSPVAGGKGTDDGDRGAVIAAGPTAVAKVHLRAFLSGDFETLKQTYAQEVRLMAGGEMLKPEYGLNGPGGRNVANTVVRDKLVGAMEKAFGEKPIIPADKIDVIFKSFAFTVLKRGKGDVAVDPPDPLDAGDGKLHFVLGDGDALIKAGPEKGDYVLFQLREKAGRWQVVAEYLD